VSYLLDTHVLLWWLTDDETLADDVKRIIDTDPRVYVSAASIWEIGIKLSLGKLSLPMPLADLLESNDVQDLPVRWIHAAEASALPLLHRDPFDRLLIAQARLEGLTLISRDEVMRRYAVPLRIV
jgi:PIN domain nuclease of toxin-antitoxin system